MNADVIVKALRHCYNEDIHGCEGCPINDIDLCYEANLELSAADLIESLQAQIAENQRFFDKWVGEEDNFQDVSSQLECARIEIEFLQAELNQYKEENELWNDSDCNTCPFSNWEACHELCRSKNELLKFAKSLADQLTKSQRREREARLEVCRRCPDGEIIDGVKHYPCGGCRWRGPEEGEPHETV